MTKVEGNREGNMMVTYTAADGSVGVQTIDFAKLSFDVKKDLGIYGLWVRLLSTQSLEDGKDLISTLTRGYSMSVSTDGAGS